MHSPLSTRSRTHGTTHFPDSQQYASQGSQPLSASSQGVKIPRNTNLAKTVQEGLLRLFADEKAFDGELKNWVSAGRPDEQRAVAAICIHDCWKRKDPCLNLSRMRLRSLPACIGELRALKLLDLGNNELVELPEALSNLTALQTLSLSGNKLAALPDGFGNLVALEVLDLDNNQLASLPEGFGNLTALSTLYLHGNPFTVLSETIRNMPAFKKMFGKEELLSLPTSLTSSEPIETSTSATAEIDIAFANARREALQGVVWPIAEVEAFSVELAKWMVAGEPNEERKKAAVRIIGCWSRADITLDLSNMGLRSLPDCIGKLTALNMLCLSANKLTTLPNAVTKLKELANLNLAGNRLTTLPDAVSRLTTLVSLTLTRNQLVEVPDALTNLTDLSELYLDGNPLTVLSETIRNMPAFKCKALFDNKWANEEFLDLPTARDISNTHLPQVSNINPEILQQIMHMQNLPTTDAAFQFVRSHLDELDRACKLVQTLPPELIDKSEAVQAYYRDLSEEFVRLHSAAALMGTGFFKMDSSAECNVATAKTVLSYMPKTMEASAAALPFPAAAILSAVSSIWIYRHNTVVKNSLEAFSGLLGQTVEARLVAQQVALHICLQREGALTRLMEGANNAPQQGLFPALREKLSDVKAFAKKYDLITNAPDPSLIRLQALEDLQKMQKALVKLLGDDPSSYEALQRAPENDKAAYLLIALDGRLKLVDTRAITDGDANEEAPARAAYPAAPPVAAVVSEVVAVDTVARGEFDVLNTQVNDLLGHVRQLTQQPRPRPMEITTAVERGRQLQKISIQLQRKSNQDELFAGAGTKIDIQRALTMIFDALGELHGNVESIRMDAALAIEDGCGESKQDNDALKRKLDSAERELEVTRQELKATRQVLGETRQTVDETNQRTNDLESRFNEAELKRAEARCCVVS